MDEQSKNLIQDESMNEDSEADPESEVGKPGSRVK
jgi:hypothetical protein